MTAAYFIIGVVLGFAAAVGLALAYVWNRRPGG
jgi:drug/metabolite transporter (DMT)-like permease